MTQENIEHQTSKVMDIAKVLIHQGKSSFNEAAQLGNSPKERQYIRGCCCLNAG